MPTHTKLFPGSLAAQNEILKQLAQRDCIVVVNKQEISSYFARREMRGFRRSAMAEKPSSSVDARFLCVLRCKYLACLQL